MTENKLNWLAGLIDGDGYFSFSKKGYALQHSALEITIDARDQRCLHEVKNLLGGAIKAGKGNWYRYRLHDKSGLLQAISAVNGRLRNPVRILQLARICEAYEISLLETPELTYDNSWLSGFIDSDGSVYINQSSVPQPRWRHRSKSKDQRDRLEHSQGKQWSYLMVKWNDYL